VANNSLAAELQMRFDLKQKEAENALLRAQQQESDARRWALWLALILTLVIIGGLAFYLMHQMRLKKRIVTVAMRDDLTGLRNRRSIMQFARLQFAERRVSLCIALLDIDHFKSFNDEYGHDVGDAVLKTFARQCRAALRNNDRLGRFGGEEFLLVMPSVELSQVPAIFERMRQATGSPQIAGLPTSLGLSFSMGATAAKSEDESLDLVIKRADRALYLAKQNGRDRCQIAEENPAAQATACGEASSARETAVGLAKQAAI
jgi:diguanylate cyclase (GGDEF)-like protein